MKILILGGTVFLGRAVTDAAITAGHDVTHFNRGKSAPPDPRVRTIQGDRTQASALAAAGSTRWDAVVDTSGFLPQVVQRSVDCLRDAGRYLFVSSVSVYRDFSAASIHEQSELLAPPDPLPEAMTPETYGGLKAGCEKVVRDAFGDRALVVRPGLIVGPRDPTDRFTYWPVRVARGGRVAAPGRPQRRVEFIDVRDLAEWMVRLLERGVGGIFNATGPGEAVSMGALLDACKAVSGSGASFEWLSEERLLAANVAPWKDMPLWIPESDAAMSGFMAIATGKARDVGLSFRPVEATVRDTLAWAATRPADHSWKAGLSAGCEAQLLA
jgi:2'-hydroxyisoflavone reductase